jgi:hypothetical protein
MGEQVAASRLRSNRWDIDPGDEEMLELVKRSERDSFDWPNPASSRL